MVELVHSKSLCMAAPAAPKARRSVWPNGVDSGDEMMRSPARSAGFTTFLRASGWSLRITQARPHW